MLSKKGLFTTSIATASVLFFTGCGAELNLPEYTKAPLQEAKHMPTKAEMSGAHAKVIMMPIDNNGLKIAEKAKLGNSMIVKINTELSKAKSVDIVKRVEKSSYDKILAKEVKAAELSKELGTDVGQADFIVTGQLSNATYTHHFTEGYNYECKDSKGNIRTCYAPPHMSYESCVEGNIKVFKLPELKEVFSNPFDECSRTGTDVRSARDVVKENNSLVREAGTEAADTATYPLKNFFAVKGYIYEKRVNKDGDIILKTTLGEKAGAKKGDDVIIYSIIDETNPLTGTTSSDTIKIGEGIISNQITPNSSWVIVDEIYGEHTPKSGDFVKILKKESLWSKGLKLIK